jgi:choline dehydrogenase
MTEAEVIVVGGGTAGAVVAARLAEAGADVLVLEAGPDPGPFGDPRWPADLLDAAALGTSYDWGFSGPGMAFERARVLGGCSAHNGAVQTWGHRADSTGGTCRAGAPTTCSRCSSAHRRSSASARMPSTS